MIREYVADTNIILYWIQPGVPQNAVTTQALSKLQSRGDRVIMLPQIAIEFWGRVTRPIGVGGLGFTVAQADAELSRVQFFFPVMHDVPVIYDDWRRLVVSARVSGAQAASPRQCECTA